MKLPTSGFRSALALIASFAVLAAVTLISAGDSVRAGAVAEIPVSFNLSQTAGNSSDPVGASSPLGHSIFAWVDATPGPTAIYETHSNGTAAEFSTPEAISSGGDAEKPAVAAAGASFIGVWLGDNDVIARASTNAGQTWLPQVTLGPIVGSAQPLVGLDPANPLNAYAVWNDSDGAGGNVYITRSTNGGQTWTPPTVIGSTFVGVAPSLAVTSDGAAHVSIVTQPEILVYKWQKVQGNPLLDISFPYGARTAELFPTEGVDVGGVQLMFDTRAVPTSVLTAHLGASGWTGPMGLSGAGPARLPNFSIDGTKAVAVWEEGTLSTSTIKAALSNDAGGTFSEGLQVTVPDVVAFDPEVVVANNIVFVVYSREAGGPTPTPPGTPVPETEVAMARIADDLINAFFEEEEEEDVGDIVWLALEMFFHGGLTWGRTLPQSAPAANSALGLLSTQTPEGDLNHDIFLRVASFAGDVDCTGVVDPADAVSLLGYLGQARNTGCLGAADVDCSDGAPSTTDLLSLLKYLGGIPYAVPAGCMPINLDVSHT